MSAWFSIEVRFLNGRYHGRDANTQPEWPPAPLRLFQAVVAGALSGRWALEDRPRTEEVLRWLEKLGAPNVLLAPKARQLRSYRLAVPNNQADRHIAALKKGVRLEKRLSSDKELKAIRPWLVGRTPIIYAWCIDDEQIIHAEAARPVVRRLVALGTGVDHAAADIRVGGECPTAGNLVPLPAGASPCAGTLQSLVARHKAELERLKTGSLRENRPPVRYRPGEPPMRRTAQLVFALHPAGDESTTLAIEPSATAVLAQQIRQSLATELMRAISKRGVADVTPEEVERLVTGHGANASEKNRRVQVSPLPSIGHVHADGLLRRVLVSVPNDFPISSDSVRRALTRCEFQMEYPSQHLLNFRLATIDESDDSELRMRERYVGRARVWRSVSPIILPGRRPNSFNTTTSPAQGEAAVRARVDAKRRADRETLFHRALIHAGLAGIAGFRLRQEPFDPHQLRASADWLLPVSAEGGKRAWLSDRPRVHAEVTFDEPQAGPILIGDGRFLGLGLFRAVMDELPDIPEAARYRLGPNGRPPVEQTVFIADVLRRALMSGGGIPPSELTGHDAQGPSRDPAHRHAFFLPEDADGDGLIDHLTVYCRFGFSDSALQRLRFLQRLWWKDRRESGRSCELALSLQKIGPPTTIPGMRRLVGPSQVWRSTTPYFRPRFRKKRDTDTTALAREQICREWSLRFPGTALPHVSELDAGRTAKFATVRTDRDRCSPDNKGGLLQLRFSGPVTGPIVLGRSSHFGLGMFVAEDL